MILIEGLPGTGKSSLAKNLYESLSDHDNAHFELFLETDRNNPFIFKSGTTLETDLDEFTLFVENAWQSFLANYDPLKSIAIQESLTIQQQLNFPLVVNEVSRGKKLILNVFNELANTKVLLIYLYSSEPAEHFRSTMMKRGEEWEEQVKRTLLDSKWYASNQTKTPVETFIQELTSHTEEIIQRASFEVLKYDIEMNTYDEIQKQVIEVIKEKFLRG